MPNTVMGMDGYERSLLYRFAIETGLRANEIRTLQKELFDFDKCTVTVQAAYSKHRRLDVLPLRKATAEEVKLFLKRKTSKAQVFNMPCESKVCEMLQEDLTDAEIPYEDDSGRFCDFHAFRHTTGTFLAANGVHPKVAMAIMRHSKIDLTMSVYTHMLTGQEAQAVDSLPDLTQPSKQLQESMVRATGTDGAPAPVRGVVI